MGDVREVGGVTIASSGAAFQMFNAAFLSSPVDAAAGDLERRILTAKVHFDARALGWSFWICEDLLAAGIRKRAEQVFTRYDLHLAVQLPGMAAARLLPPRRKLPSIEIRRVEDEATRTAFCDIGCTCFHVPVRWFREIFFTEHVWRGGFVGYVGYTDGEPVATAATVTAAGAIGVYNVATVPAHRRRGFGEAVMRHAIDAAHRESGEERTILQATEHGLHLYLSMGYKVVTNVAVYASRD